jgi:hypothetical protein
MEHRQARYGQHTRLVDEVIDFAFGGRILFAIGAAEESKHIWITNDLHQAQLLNFGEGCGRFRMHADQDTHDWGNTEVLARNLRHADEGRPEVEEVPEESTWGWHDLTENLVAELIWTEEFYDNPEKRVIDKLLSKEFIYSSLERELKQHLEKILPAVEAQGGWESCADHLANNMASDLWHCAENRAYNGMTENFWEQLFGLYKQGVWPCGWLGVFPAPGKFIAYRRA